MITGSSSLPFSSGIKVTTPAKPRSRATSIFSGRRDQPHDRFSSGSRTVHVVDGS
jgi:hypothetical protein